METLVSVDVQLHLALTQAAKNPVLTKVLAVIWSVLPQRIRYIATPDGVPTFLSFHREIFAALASHDPAAARPAMERHAGFLVTATDAERQT